MKTRSYVLLFLFSALAAGCGTQKRIPQTAYLPAAAGNAPSAGYPASAASSRPAAALPATPADNGSIRINQERVSLADGESNPLRRYNIIVGSFGVYQNAVNLKDRLTSQGYQPTLLRNESGMYRVCVASFDDESPAREQVRAVKSRFPEFSDAWLLIASR